MTSHHQNLAALAILVAAGCGDPLATSDYRGDPIYPVYSVSGTVKRSNPAPSSVARRALVGDDNLEVGVVWIRRLAPERSVLLLESAGASLLEGPLPATFDAQVLTPPSALLHGNYAFGDRAAGSAVGPAIATGLLVVAEAGTLDQLPAEVEESYSGEDLSPTGALGDLLSRFVYVSPALPTHIEGAASNGFEPIDPGFRLEDYSQWITSERWAVCQNAVYGSVTQTQPWQDCIAPSSPQTVECATACAGSSSVEDCTASCVSSACQIQLTVPLIEAQCGPAPEPRELDVAPIPSTGLDVDLSKDNAQDDVFRPGSVIPNFWTNG
jgi:hypothetical protein